MQVIYDEIFMRPIMSGATDGSNNDHAVQFWLNKWGPENQVLIDVKPPDGRESWGDVNAPLESLLVVNPFTSGSFSSCSFTDRTFSGSCSYCCPYLAGCRSSGFPRFACGCPSFASCCACLVACCCSVVQWCQNREYNRDY
jgi:hypothetical protein